jgi:hypothetical protein
VVLDGEIIPSNNGEPLPFALMQTRIGRKNISKKQLQEAPISFFAYDMLEYNGIDIRTEPLQRKKTQTGAGCTWCISASADPSTGTFAAFCCDPFYLMGCAN